MKGVRYMMEEGWLGRDELLLDGPAKRAVERISLHVVHVQPDKWGPETRWFKVEQAMALESWDEPGANFTADVMSELSLHAQMIGEQVVLATCSKGTRAWVLKDGVVQILKKHVVPLLDYSGDWPGREWGDIWPLRGDVENFMHFAIRCQKELDRRWLMFIALRHNKITFNLSDVLSRKTFDQIWEMRDDEDWLYDLVMKEGPLPEIVREAVACGVQKYTGYRRVHIEALINLHDRWETGFRACPHYLPWSVIGRALLRTEGSFE